MNQTTMGATQESEAIIVTIANQKGGVGKSTLTALMATALHHLADFSLAVIDCDNQGTLLKMRDYDLSNIELMKKEYEEKKAKGEEVYLPVGIDKAPYPIFKADVENLLPMVKKYALEYDLIFLDVPGMLDFGGQNNTYTKSMMQNIYTASDLVIVPLTPSRVDVESSQDFIDYSSRIAQLREKVGLSLKLCSIINMASRTTENSYLEEVAKTEGLHLFKTRIRDLVRYKRNVSTIIPLHNLYDGEEDETYLLAGELFNELENIIDSN